MHLLIRVRHRDFEDRAGEGSTETDANLSFDTAGPDGQGAAVHRALRSAGNQRERILIKIASSWEGIRAAEMLQEEGINCNMTLLFSLPQAVACAEAKAQLISPFVGRILDWHKKADREKGFCPGGRPGRALGEGDLRYYKKFGHATEVMGASFRNVGEILELAGCDLLTISPQLLGRTSKERRAGAAQIESGNGARKQNVNGCRWTRKSSAGCSMKTRWRRRKRPKASGSFNADAVKLAQFVAAKLEGGIELGRY